MSSRKNQEGVRVVLQKPEDVRTKFLEGYFNFGGRAVPQPYPNDFGRETIKKAPLMKVRILRDDGEALLSRKIPNGLVASTGKVEVPNVLRAGI
jgi:hypothetical protein